MQIRFLWISSMCFDLSVYDIFGAFSKGATMVIIPTQKDIDNIARVLDEKKITLWNSVPAIMELVVEKITEEKRGVLNKIMLSGDWIPVKLPEKIWKHWQNAKIYSLGGATEASIWSIYYPIEKVEKDWKSIPYGMPLANQSFYVLNSDLNETPVEVSGELYIGGVGLAECYHNDPEKTEKSFINHKRLGRIYKTGDHGVLHRAGYIEFQGRKDFQVKIKGYRIELGEIEAAILDYNGIKSAVVIDNKDTDNNKYLCAFVVADESITAADIRASISTRLADYMIPAQIMTVDYIPLTSNGKVDRKRLIELLEESLRSKNNPLKSESRFISDDTTEKEIYGIWKNIFRNENIALDDNFFELGGDSLMGQRMLSEINKRFDVRIPAIELFRRQSIKALAEFLKTDMLPEKQIEIPSVNSTQSDELFFWAPNSHWRVENNNLVINDTVYETDYLQLFPKLYFTAQTGLSRKNLENVCKNSALVEKAFDELRNNKVLIDTLQTPSEVFSSQRRLYKNKFGDEIKYNSVEYSKFKNSTIKRKNNHTELKKVDIFDNSKEMPLFITERKSHRKFNEDGIITFKEFSKMVNMFKIADADNPEKRRYYASAGGLYSIDIYFYIKDSRVENLDGGLYYFNPIDNKLVMIEQSFEQDGDVHYFKNRDIFNSSAFTMYFIYNAEANMPIYGTDGYLYACIDTGLMVGHLTSIAELTNIGLCSIGEINFEKIKHHFKLNKNQLLIHTVEGGLKINEVNNHIENRFQLSGAQKGIYILSMFNKEDLRYNNPLILKIAGNLDTEKVKFCFGELIKRHELLRASVKMENLIPYNVISNEGKLNFEIKEIGNNTIESLYNQFVTPFNLESETLMRILVVKESEESFYLMVDIHHVIGDRASLGIMLYELERLYNGEKLPELKVTYRDYIEKLNRDKKKESYQVQREYWKNMFKDEIPLLELPTDYSRNELIQDNPLTTSGGNYKFELSKEIKDRVTYLARHYKTTLYNILLASYYVMLYKYTGQKDIVVGTPVSMRDDADFSDTVGMFINTVALRNKIDPETSFGNFLNNVKETIYGAFENKGFAFEELVSELGINRDHGRNPIFDTMFVLQDKNIFTLNLKNISVSVDEFCSTNSKFELTLLAVENENGLTLNFEYMKGLYKEESIKRMAKHFTNIVTAVTDKPETKVKDIEVLGDDEKGIILHQFNRPFFDFDETEKIFNRFEKIVGLYPDNIAVVYEDNNMTYRELNEKANQFARSLIINGVKPNEIVGLMVDKSLELMISILGVLKAGAAYLPMDINYPESRLEYMAKDSGLKVLITERKYESKCSSNAQLIFIDEIELDSYDNGNLDIDYTGAELAYVIYTSGTTGNPKGVMIKHSGIISMIIGLENILNIDERDKITQFANISFDASVFEMFITLLNGAALYVLNMNIIGNYTQIENYINDNGITLMVLPPTYANYLNPENIKGLRLLFTAGSESNFELIKKWTSSDKPVRYINGYGPTENTICATTWEALDNLNYNTVPIGKPLDNIKTYICDRDLNLLPVGIPGELCLGGKNVGLGYLNKRELTDEKFVSASFDNGKIYRTGDLARWLTDGNIEFLGRIDQQVKIRGYRIELEEIEKKILSFEGVIEVCVIAKDSKNGEKYLSGYYTSNREIQSVDLKRYLEKYLPIFMIPSFLVRLDKMPLTANDKIDKKQLAKINDIPQTSSSEEFTKKNQEEYTIEKIWKEVLNIDTVGLYDNFFEIGGSSIDLISVNTKINKEFKTDISAVNMFRYPTINSLADYIKNNSTNLENREKEVVTTGRNRLKQRISMIRGGTNE